MPSSAFSWKTITSFVRDVLLYTDTPAAEATAFRSYTDATTARIASALCAVSFAATLLWWPLDFVLYARQPHILRAMVDWRLSTIVVTALGFSLPFLPAFVRRHPAAWIGSCATAAFWAATWTCGRVAPLSPEWFGIAYVIPVASIAFVVPFLERILLASLFAAASWSGYFLGNPQHLAAERHVGTTISFMLIVVVGTVAVGHLSFHYLRLGFFAQRQLAAMKDELEDRVRAQTTDLRQFAGRLERLRERERREIAGELEAGPGEELSAVEFEAGLLEESAARRGIRLPLTQVRALVERMRETFGRRLGALRLRSLDDGDLASAVHRLAEEQRLTTGLEIAVSVEPADLPVSAEAASAAYRIVQEALTNVVKHAGATRVEIVLRLEGEAFVATVHDDGRGLTERALWRPESIGVVGMQERALMIGGQLSVGRDPAGGTRVTLRAPRIAEAA